MTGNDVHPPVSFDEAYAAEQLRRSRHPLRRLIKAAYLRNMLGYLSGPTVDFGCGAGQLLARLPIGSVGIEVNPVLVQRLVGQGLEVFRAHGDYRDFDLANLPPRRFECLVIAHVLEHLDDPARALAALMAACQRFGIWRVLMVVPGSKGFMSDTTHRTLIDEAWLADHPLPADCGFTPSTVAYFPGPRQFGPLFTYHEMLVTFDRPAPTVGA
jgi:SAM-dependent methyltransferase